MKITNVRVQNLVARWDVLFGGADKVPNELLHPSANFSGSKPPRLGQFSTLVFVETDEGVTGVGEAWALPDPVVVSTVIEKRLAPMLLGRDPQSTEQIWEEMAGAWENAFLRGTLFEAMSGIDIALWDIKAKALGLPIHKVLGGPTRRRVATYASPVPLGAPEDGARRAREFVDKGFKAIKIKIGSSLERDIARIRAIQAEVGPEVMLVTDANGAYRVPNAVVMSRRLAEIGVSWLEEPVAVHDRAGLAEVRSKSEIAVVTGENEHTVEGVADLLRLKATDAVQINITRCGGITGARRIALAAAAHNVPMSPHGVGSAVGVAAVLQLLATIPNFWIYEYNQLLNPLRDTLLTEPIGFEDGELLVPDRPGLGVELNPEVLERFAV